MKWTPRLAAGLLTSLALCAPAANATVYPLLGDGDAPLRPGVLAADADIRSGPSDVAIRSDGVIAFVSGETVFWVEHGLVRRVPVPPYGDLDLAFAHDGRLLVATCKTFTDSGAAMVFDAAPGRAANPIAGSATRQGRAGDGGPAIAATFECAAAVDVDRDGGILIADPDARRVRRIDPAGVISTVAGSGAVGPSGDGGPAAAAGLSAPVDVAALPGGGFAIVDRSAEIRPDTPSLLRVVDASGTIRTILAAGLDRVAASADGSLYTVDWTDEDGAVTRVAPDGARTTVARVRQDRVGISPFLPVAGDPFGSDAIEADAIAAAPDGGVLVGADFAVQYVPPAAAALLATAILPATRRVTPDFAVTLTTTIPAGLRVELWRRGRRFARVGAFAPGGTTVVPIPVGSSLVNTSYASGHRRRPGLGRACRRPRRGPAADGIRPRLAAKPARPLRDLREPRRRTRSTAAAWGDGASTAQWSSRRAAPALRAFVLPSTECCPCSRMTADAARSRQIHRKPELGDARRRRPNLR